MATTGFGCCWWDDDRAAGTQAEQAELQRPSTQKTKGPGRGGEGREGEGAKSTHSLY